ncbi:MAG: hypothetical protein JWO44_2390 [Bacteroidetes bacterium]|nr:hypothetical protein [Bacteroidota bacterium]
MKTKTIIVAAIAGMAVMSSCQTKEQKLENAQENVADANADLDQARREFREESENNLRENDMTIETYRANLKNEKEEMRAQYERKADSLEQRNKELRARLDSYKDDDKDNEKWESFKREFKHDMDEMKTSLKDVGKNNVK